MQNIKFIKIKQYKEFIIYPLQRNKLGFILNSSGPSEISYSVLNGAMERDDLDTFLFFLQIDKPCIFSTVCQMFYTQAYGFDGPIIATDLNTASKLLQMPTPHKKYFFLNDLEWIRFPQKNYHELEEIYRNTELTLLARCEDHKKLIESCWNKKVERIIENYNFFQLDFINELVLNGRLKYSGRSTNYTNKLVTTSNNLGL